MGAEVDTALTQVSLEFAEPDDCELFLTVRTYRKKIFFEHEGLHIVTSSGVQPTLNYY
jgi:hypothetical protein